MVDLMGDDFRVWFEKELATLHQAAVDQIAAGSSLPPMLVLFDLNNRAAILPVSMDTVEDKERLVRLHKRAASPGFGNGCVFISEVWIALVDNHADSEVVNRSGLENWPGRSEAVVWNALRGDRQLLAMAHIDRATNTLGPWKIIDPSRSLMQGRMVLERTVH